MVERARKRLRKRARRGFRGYPIATVALYGPDDTTAAKLTVGIFPAENVEITDLRRWFSEGADIRNDAGVAEELHRPGSLIAPSCPETVLGHWPAGAQRILIGGSLLPADAAPTGRTHDRKRLRLLITHKVLAARGPSTHDPLPAPEVVTGPFQSVQRSGRRVVRELDDSGGDPAPSVRAIVIAGGRELVNPRAAFLKRFAAVALNHQVGGSPSLSGQ